MTALIFLVFWLFALLIMLCVSVVTVWFFSLSNAYSFFYSTVSGSITSGFSIGLAWWTWVLLTCLGSWKNKTFFLQLCQMVCWVEQHRLASMVFRVWSTLLQDPLAIKFPLKISYCSDGFSFICNFSSPSCCFQNCLCCAHLLLWYGYSRGPDARGSKTEGLKQWIVALGNMKAELHLCHRLSLQLLLCKVGPIAACPSGSACEI